MFPSIETVIQHRREFLTLQISLLRNALEYVEQERSKSPYQELNLFKSPDYYHLVTQSARNNRPRHINGLIYPVNSGSEPISLFSGDFAQDPSPLEIEDKDGVDTKSDEESRTKEHRKPEVPSTLTVVIPDDEITESDTDEEYVWDWEAIEHR